MSGVLVSPCGRPFPMEGNLTRYWVFLQNSTVKSISRRQNKWARSQNSCRIQVSDRLFCPNFARKWKDQRWFASLKVGVAWTVHQHVQNECTQWWMNAGLTSKKMTVWIMLCICLRVCRLQTALCTSINHNPCGPFSLSSLIRHEDRPDFKKVEESMRSYHYSISNKAKVEGAEAAAAEPTK